MHLVNTYKVGCWHFNYTWRLGVGSRTLQYKFRSYFSTRVSHTRVVSCAVTASHHLRAILIIIIY